jgi:hypothetical protein
MSLSEHQGATAMFDDDEEASYVKGIDLRMAKLFDEESNSKKYHFLAVAPYSNCSDHTIARE